MLPIIQTEQGLVEGLPGFIPGITIFRGIPYALPPIGELRFQAPVPPAKYQGVYQAFSFAPMSMQAKPSSYQGCYHKYENQNNNLSMSEDCLYLNIWTPANHTSDRLPVLVWFFGGGQQVGRTSAPEIDGEQLANQGIIVVTVNYRLNVFGFLSHPELTATQPDAPTNFGHLDQQASIFWIKQNIAAFGGNPDEITIGGHSSGGSSVLYQIINPKNKGLFQRAIVSSGCARNPYNNTVFHLNLSDAEKVGERFFESLGIHTIKEAREIDAEILCKKATLFQDFFGTVVNDTFAPNYYLDTLSQGKFQDISLLIGHTNDEFIAKPMVKSDAELDEILEQVFKEDASDCKSLCKNKNNLAERIETVKLSAVEYAIRTIAAEYQKHQYHSPIYYYNFIGEALHNPQKPAYHASDIPYFFETLKRFGSVYDSADEEISRQMSTYLTNFVKTGNPSVDAPNHIIKTVWKPFSKEQQNVMQFDETSHLEVVPPSKLMELLLKDDIELFYR